jgi:hypothetical protein
VLRFTPPPLSVYPLPKEYNLGQDWFNDKKLATELRRTRGHLQPEQGEHSDVNTEDGFINGLYVTPSVAGTKICDRLWIISEYKRNPCLPSRTRVWSLSEERFVVENPSTNGTTYPTPHSLYMSL